MKKKKRATVETEKIEEKNTAQERSRVSIRVGQRTIISLIVAVSVAVIAYAALWILAGTVNSKSERNLDRHAQECAEYIAHIVNEHKAEDDIGRAVDEIKTMAYSLSARIVIVDTDYKVVVDSYGKDTGRYLVDENWRIISADDNFEELTGYSKEDIENNIITQIDLIPDEDKTEYLCQVNANLAKSTFVFQEHKIHRKDGRDIYVLCSGRMFYDSAIQKDRGEIVIVDVSSTYALKMLTDAEQNKADVRLRNWENTYRTDPLTGLLNHAAFRSDMEQRLLECTHTAVMIMMDVDRFKQYNDTYGHHNGDKYLVLVAQTLQAALRGDDHACRMGGDEFAAMLFFNKSVSDDVIRERAQQIFDKVNLTVKATEGGTGISMGAVIARTELTFNEMYEEADNALYNVKESGRGRIEVKRHGE